MERQVPIVSRRATRIQMPRQITLFLRFVVVIIRRRALPDPYPTNLGTVLILLMRCVYHVIRAMIAKLNVADLRFAEEAACFEVNSR